MYMEPTNTQESTTTTSPTSDTVAPLLTMKHPFNEATVDHLRQEVKRLHEAIVVEYSDIDIRSLMYVFHNIVEHQFNHRITHGPESVSSAIGISAMELLKDCNLESDTAEAHDIIRSLEHLHEEGFVYSTIDEYHYLATAFSDK